MPICPVCSTHKHSILLEYQHWLSASKIPNEYRHLTYWCEKGKHYIIIQRQQTGNPNLPTAIRVLILIPTGKAAKAAVSRRYGIGGKRQERSSVFEKYQHSIISQ